MTALPLPWAMLWLFSSSPPVPGPCPATLSGRTFYLSRELDRLQDDRFDPEDWVDGNPSALVFKGPGQVEVRGAQDGETCSFTVADAGTPFELETTCGSGQYAWHGRAHWEWLGPNRVFTDLLDLRPHDTKPAPLTEFMELPAGAEVDTAVLLRRFEARYAAAHLPALVGRYQDAYGSTLEVLTDGGVLLEGKQIPARVARCLPEDGKHAPAPCLYWRQAQRSFLAVATRQGLALEEGTNPSEVAYRPFEPLPGGRRFIKALGPAQPQVPRLRSQARFLCSNPSTKGSVKFSAAPGAVHVSVTGQGPCPSEVEEWGVTVQPPATGDGFIKIVGRGGKPSRCLCHGEAMFEVEPVAAGRYRVEVGGGFNRALADQVTVPP